jgi:hypothetical protein
MIIFAYVLGTHIVNCMLCICTETETPLCKHRPRTHTWADTHPVGYFYENTWTIIGCQHHIVRSREKLMTCLRNKHVLLIGDSNLFILYKIVAKRLQLPWQSKIFRKTSVDNPYWFSSRDKHGTILIECVPHGTPVPLQLLSSSKNINTMTPPISAYLDDLDSNSSAIIVVYIYGHILRYPTAVFQLRMANVRSAAERLFARAPNVQIFIQGPHTYLPPAELLSHDIYGRVFSDIIHREFSNLRDKVFFLDYWDMTVGVGEYQNIHPNDVVNDAMLDQLLAYIC